MPDESIRAVQRGGLTTSWDGKINPGPDFPKYPIPLMGQGAVLYACRTLAGELNKTIPSPPIQDPEINFQRNHELIMLDRKPIDQRIDFWTLKVQEALEKMPQLRSNLLVTISRILKLELGDERKFYKLSEDQIVPTIKIVAAKFGIELQNEK